jgi:RNA polymerase sigma-70 factor (ECF subfamily)
MGKQPERTGALPDQSEFPTTHWSVVPAAADAEPERASRALAHLCRVYWYPLYVYVRRLGYSPEDAGQRARRSSNRRPILCKLYAKTPKPT